MPRIRERYFILAQVPKKYFPRFIEKIGENPKIGTILEYESVYFAILGKEHYTSRPEKGAKPIGEEIGEVPSVLWIGSCNLSDWKEALKYVSDAHPWEVPMVFGGVFDFPYPTKEEREKKHENEIDLIE